MKAAAICVVFLSLAGCNELKIEELAFRNALIHDSIELCEPGHEACVLAFRDQTKACMESNDWRAYMNSPDNEAELDRFTRAFYGCIVDSAGNPYIAL